MILLSPSWASGAVQWLLLLLRSCADTGGAANHDDDDDDEDKVVTGDICFLVRVQLSESYLCARHFTAHDFFYLIYIDKSMQQLPETMLAAELSYVFLSRFHFQI